VNQVSDCTKLFQAHYKCRGFNPGQLWPSRHRAPPVSIDPDSCFERYRVIPGHRCHGFDPASVFWSTHWRSQHPVCQRCFGRAASGGAPEPPRATRNQPEPRIFWIKFIYFFKNLKSDNSWDGHDMRCPISMSDFTSDFMSDFMSDVMSDFQLWSQVLCSSSFVLSFWFVFLFRFWLKKLTCPVLEKKNSCPGYYGKDNAGRAAKTTYGTQVPS